MLRLVQKLAVCLFRQTQYIRPIQTARFFAEEYDKNYIRKFKYLQSGRHPDLVIYKKQLLYRAAHMGQKELELIIEKWLRHSMDKMTYEQLAKFEDEVLLTDNMVLFNHILGDKLVPNLAEDSYLAQIKKFAYSNENKSNIRFR